MSGMGRAGEGGVCRTVFSFTILTTIAFCLPVYSGYNIIHSVTSKTTLRAYLRLHAESLGVLTASEPCLTQPASRCLHHAVRHEIRVPECTNLDLRY
jgi:hypothetical protein